MSARSLRRNHARQLDEARRRNQRRSKRAGIAAGAALGASMLLAPSALAEDFVVNTNADATADGCTTAANGCTLRDAIDDANTNAEADTISFADGVDLIRLTEGELVIDGPDDLDITDAPTNDVTISGDATDDGPSSDDSRIFNVETTDPVTMTGLNLTQGYYDQQNGPQAILGGGAIYTYLDSDLTMTDSSITDSNAYLGGGAILARSSSVELNDTDITGNFALFGGGILTTPFRDYQASDPYYGPSTLAVNGGKISDNYGVIAGGGVLKYTDSTFTDVTVDGNQSQGGVGGILQGGGSLDMSDSAITGNRATDGGAGGLEAGKYAELSITDSEISGNDAADSGGGVILNGKYRGGFSEPLAVAEPGGNVEIVDTTISDNTAGAIGGGVYVEGDVVGDLLISRSTVSGNQAIPDPEDASEYTLGGGIGFNTYIAGSVDVSDSTISGNSASSGGGVSFDDGYRDDEPPMSARAEGARDALSAMSRSPLKTELRKGLKAEVKAEQEQRREVVGDGSISFDNTTIAANDADYTGGGIYLGGYYGDDPYAEKPNVSSTIPLSSTIVADNTAGGAANDLEQASNSDGGGFRLTNSLIETPDGAPITQAPSGSSILGTDPDLGPLTDNGGPTLTQLPSTTSPVIDVGLANGLAVDQRGEQRTVDGSGAANGPGDGTDIGSVEVQNPSTSGIRPLLPSEVPAGCLIPFSKASLALAGDGTANTIVGSDGSDILRGFGGDDTILGKPGDDCLTGDDDDDTVNGASGDDFGDGGSGKDVMNAGSGDDAFQGRGGNDVINMGSGSDSGIGGGADDKINGGNGQDDLRGRSGNDKVFGHGGKDNLKGGRDDDKVKGGGGNDVLHGGAGKDVVDGGGGKDKIHCGTGKGDVAIASKNDTVDHDCEIVK